jgi:hypothetical protein
VAINTSGDFYSIYKKERSHYDPKTFVCAEATVSSLLKEVTTSEHPGMLLGKVQSGKTRTFISALALAFDNDYQVAVILTKNSKALLEQTKKRLDDEFKSFIADGELDIYDIMAAPTSFSKFELESKLIFVVKKQGDNLRRLAKLFSDNKTSLANCRTLIIDDEADNASVGYTAKAGIIEAKKIALQISQLRSVVKQVSYLQVTATPYSLYLQPDSVQVSNSTAFSPTRPRFTELVPVPDSYIGGDTYFGESARSTTPTLESLIHKTVSATEFDILKASDRRRFKIEESLTSPAIEGLRNAIVTFITGGMIQRTIAEKKGGKIKTLRYSFLIHSEAGKGAHAWQEKVIEALHAQLLEEATKGGPRLGPLVEAAYQDLSQSIRLNGDTPPSLASVKDLVIEALKGQYITISKVNSDEEIISMLDSTGQLKLRSPLNIFIGGQVLDRGVTLDKLIGFYYGRRPNRFQQDTVLQHSRMYGYRRAELGVTRFYTSNYIRRAMFEMEEFDSSLRAALEKGGGNAVQFIRRADNGSIIPCSPNKILVSTTHTLRAFRRILPIGFQTKHKTHIDKAILAIDQIVKANGGFNANAPLLVDESLALDLLDRIEPTLEYIEEEDSEPFDWNAAKAILRYLARLKSSKAPGKVYLWAADGRDSARYASEASHATFIETPDSEKTEGKLARENAIDYPILFLLRQNGKKDKGWRDANFYWPVLRAQRNTPTSIYASDSID